MTSFTLTCNVTGELGFNGRAEFQRARRRVPFSCYHRQINQFVQQQQTSARRNMSAAAAPGITAFCSMKIRMICSILCCFGGVRAEVGGLRPSCIPGCRRHVVVGNNVCRKPGTYQPRDIFCRRRQKAKTNSKMFKVRQRKISGPKRR